MFYIWKTQGFSVHENLYTVYFANDVFFWLQVFPLQLLHYQEFHKLWRH